MKQDGPNPRGARIATSLIASVAALMALAASLATRVSPARAAAPVVKLGYNQHIRPILSDNCFYCHGPDKNHRKGKFRLDDRDAAIAIGAIVPGKPDDSELLRRIRSDDADEQMPPPETHKSLTSEQKDLLSRWIAEGAKYEPYWAYVAPQRPVTPQTKNSTWVRNPIDAFILSTLESNRIEPSREADRRTLLRRLSLDLIGLPPTPSEVDAFVNDASTDAYEKQIDRLLASPHFGERMAVPWLDAVRFADTVGFHGDQNQNIFPYRDYVIDSFNKNKPFDQFTIEQLAGDLLPHPTTEQLIATGFNRLNMMTREGGAQPKEYLAKYAADRVRTVSLAFLGSTMGCCECHDHKYDPFKTKDFYAMSAFFADIKQWGVYEDYSYTPNPDLKGFTNDHPFPPELIVDSPYLQKRIATLYEQADRIVAASTGKLLEEPAKRADFDRWRQETATFLRSNPTGWVTPVLASSEEHPAPATGKKRSKAAKSIAAASKTSEPTVAKTSVQQSDGSILFSKQAENDRLEFTLPVGTIAALRIEALPDEKFGERIVVDNTPPKTPMTVAVSLKTAGGGEKSQQLAIFSADADAKDEHYVNGRAIVGIRSGWKVSSQSLTSPQTAIYILSSAVKTAAGDQLAVVLDHCRLARVRISISPIALFDLTKPDSISSLQNAIDAANKSGSSAAGLLLCRTCVLSTHWAPDALAEIRKVQDEIAQCRGGKSPTLVTVAVPPAVTRVLPRGNWQDQSGEVVQPAVPQFLPGSTNTDGRRLTRLDLAKWLVADENPLTSRAVMNRVWKQFFGNGISAVVEDLGGQGEWPSHPELLDWLAVEFRESKWDVKHMVRLMVTSSTYRQDSRLRPELRVVDPNNRLLASQNPRRLEAEFVRDNALAIAGLINLDIGGPSVKPYQPVGYYANIQFPDRGYSPETDSRQYRRGIYMHWQRTFLHPMLANFDAPSREDAVCSRNVSNTPQQALTLLNDPEFVEAARVLAQRVIAQSDTADKRLEAIYQLALSRAPKPAEVESLKRFYDTEWKYYSSNDRDAARLVKIGIAPVDQNIPIAELATWTSVCRVVLNLQETITKY